MRGKSRFKIISVILSFFIIITLISFENINVKANNIASKPNFKITDLTATPNKAKVGEDILVSGKIEPEDFETIMQPKEIVLVLDTSGSMADKVYIKNNSSTKIQELKKAAKSFIETMKDVPNLKIGIVAYSTEGTINPIENLGEKNVDSYDFGKHKIIKYKSYSQEFLSNDNSKLTNIIDCLKPLGGTNIGEGIRKAIYMLKNGDKNANKNIVLMTDGIPTFYSVEGSTRKEYIKIDSSNPETAGEGVGIDNNSLKYAKNIGDIVNYNMYKSYSIGYGLDKSSIEYFKEIHASMNGLADIKYANKDTGFFESSDGSIIEIFNQIAQNIKNSYELKDISLDLAFNKFFTLNIGENKVNIGNINYNKISEDIINGKVRYHAEPVNFSFTVKGSEVGNSQSIFNNIDINFLYNDENITINSKENVQVDIVSNELPNIEAELPENLKIISANENEDITISYDIDPKSFSFNDKNNIRQSDVIFVIDVSKDMGNYMKYLVENLDSEIFNNKNLKDMKTKYSIITFSNEVKCITSDLEPSKYNNYNDYILDLNNKCIEKLKVGNSNSKSLSETYDVLPINKGKETNIIFISKESNVSYGKESDYEILRGKGYNIITLEIENNNSSSESNSNEKGIGNGNDKQNLKDLHNALNAKESNYFYCQNKEDLKNNILSKVADSIISNKGYNNYTFNPTLQIDLGKSLEIVNGAESVFNNIATIKIPEIIYKYSKTNNMYNADKTTIKFTIKVKNGEIGKLTFGSYNKLIYKKLIENQDKYSIVETPTIIVNQIIKDLTHGLYNGIVNNKVEIKENTLVNGSDNQLSIAGGSTLIMGSTFNTSSNSIEASLNIDDNFEVVKASDIIVYKVINNNGIETIEKVGEEKSSGSYTVDYIDGQTNKFKILINGFNDKNQDTKILIVYKGSIKDNISNETLLKNAIDFTNGVYKDFSIKINTDTKELPKLPDLF